MNHEKHTEKVNKYQVLKEKLSHYEAFLLTVTPVPHRGSPYRDSQEERVMEWSVTSKVYLCQEKNIKPFLNKNNSYNICPMAR
ncbi:MAG: hypothetical protein HY276_09510 [Ignavibacteriales bacterium]|nr:hypothetical protein [Ignavibacteriales bacterium]